MLRASTPPPPRTIFDREVYHAYPFLRSFPSLSPIPSSFPAHPRHYSALLRPGPLSADTIRGNQPLLPIIFIPPVFLSHTLSSSQSARAFTPPSHTPIGNHSHTYLPHLRPFSPNLSAFVIDCMHIQPSLPSFHSLALKGANHHHVQPASLEPIGLHERCQPLYTRRTSSAYSTSV